MRAIVLGNCQSVTFRNLAERMVPSIHFDVHEAHNLSEDFASLVADYDYAFVQPHILKALSERKPFDRVKLVPFPRCSFAGLHPDLMYVTHRGEKIVTLLSASFPQPDVAQRLKRPAWGRYLPFLKGRN